MKCLTNLMFFFAILSQSVFAQFSATQASEQLAKTLGIDIKGYKIYSNPSNNYGLGTSCLKTFSLSKGNVACDMIDCYGLSAFPENSEQWKTVNGMAYKGVNNGIYVTKEASKNFGINVLVPKILQFLGISASYANSSSIEVNITIDSLLIRSLNYDNYIKHVQQSPQDQRLYKGFAKRHLFIAVADFVLMGYRVELTPKDSIAGTFSAKVDSAMKIGAVTLDKDSLGLIFSKKSNGSVIVSSNKPVILGVSVVKQKKIATEEKGNAFSEENGWEAVDPASFDDPTKRK